jgi:hypothetical protein
MTGTRNRPALRLVIATAIATSSAAVAVMFSGGHDAAAQVHARAHAARPAASTSAVSSAELALRQDMRRLWSEHVAWTRLAVISLTTGSPDTNATVARLLRNQSDIGNAIAPFYGRAAGTQLTRLLRQHITVAADLIAAAKAGDKGKLASEQAAWQRNADRIARFLSGANPEAWKLVEMRTMLHTHLALTTQEVVARLQGKWATDVRSYDAISRQALGMADMLSSGIVQQFPGRFS